MKKNSPNLSHRLTRYSLAASAAGLAAGAGIADAAINVYDNGGAGWTIADGSDLTFQRNGTVGTTTGLTSGVVLFNGSRLRGINAVSYYNRLVIKRLGYGESMPGTLFQVYNGFFSYDGYGYNNWSVPNNGYIGLSFDVEGTKYYGWMDITLDAFSPSDTIVVNRYAVESTSNTPIIIGNTGAGGGSSAVPEPGTLALLALGATGLAALRRRQG